MVDAANHTRTVRLRAQVRSEGTDEVDGLESFLPEVETTRLIVVADASNDIAPPMPAPEPALRRWRPPHPRLPVAPRRVWWRASTARLARLSYPHLVAAGRLARLSLSRAIAGGRLAYVSLRRALADERLSRLSLRRVIAGGRLAHLSLPHAFVGARLGRPSVVRMIPSGRLPRASVARVIASARLSHLSLPKLTVGGRRAALIVLAGMVAAAVPLRMLVPQSAAPVTPAAIAPELPATARFDASVFRAPVAPRRTPPRTVAVSAVRADSDRRAIQAALNGYRDALSTLDAKAVASVWPAANVAALRQQFAAIPDQNVEFDGCRISVETASANASCTGIIESGLLPRAARRPRSTRTWWHFTLDRAGHRWVIRSVATGAN